MCLRTNLPIAWSLHLQIVAGPGTPDSLDMERAGKHEGLHSIWKTLKQELQFIPSKSNPKSNLLEHHGRLNCSDFLRGHKSQQKQVSKISRYIWIPTFVYLRQQCSLEQRSPETITFVAAVERYCNISELVSPCRAFYSRWAHAENACGGQITRKQY